MYNLIDETKVSNFFDNVQKALKGLDATKFGAHAASCKYYRKLFQGMDGVGLMSSELRVFTALSKATDVPLDIYKE
jgi:hypothetical protein